MYNYALSTPEFLNDMPAAYAVLHPYADDDGEPCGITFIYVNNAFANIFNMSREYIMGAKLCDVLPQADFSWVKLCAQSAYGEQKLHTVKYSSCFEKLLSVSAYPLKNDMCACIIRDVTEQRQIRAQRSAATAALRHAAETDALTGLYNSGAGRTLAQNALCMGEQCALFIFDMDDFKSINDSMGHQQGDSALCTLADVLRRCFRTEDIIWRHGGDEFAALMPNCTGKRLIRRKCKQIKAMLAHGRIPLSCSIGAVCGSGNFRTMFAAADNALYKTKAAGKCGCTIVTLGNETKKQ